MPNYILVFYSKLNILKERLICIDLHIIRVFNFPCHIKVLGLFLKIAVLLLEIFLIFKISRCSFPKFSQVLFQKEPGKGLLYWSIRIEVYKKWYNFFYFIFRFIVWDIGNFKFCSVDRLLMYKKMFLSSILIKLWCRASVNSTNTWPD